MTSGLKWTMGASLVAAVCAIYVFGGGSRIPGNVRVVNREPGAISAGSLGPAGAAKLPPDKALTASRSSSALPTEAPPAPPAIRNLTRLMNQLATAKLSLQAAQVAMVEYKRCVGLPEEDAYRGVQGLCGQYAETLAQIYPSLRPAANEIVSRSVAFVPNKKVTAPALKSTLSPPSK